MADPCIMREALRHPQDELNRFRLNLAILDSIGFKISVILYWFVCLKNPIKYLRWLINGHEHTQWLFLSLAADV
jgi:hypothetical protein